MNDEELRRAMRPMTKEELEARDLAQARLMRGMTDEELGARYGHGLRNSTFTKSMGMGRDLKNEELIKALAEGRFDKFMARANSDSPYLNNPEQS